MTTAAEHRPVILINSKLKVHFLVSYTVVHVYFMKQLYDLQVFQICHDINKYR